MSYTLSNNLLYFWNIDDPFETFDHLKPQQNFIEENWDEDDYPISSSHVRNV